MQPVPLGFLNKATCAFTPVASLGVLGVNTEGGYESAAYNNDTQQVVFTLYNATTEQATIMALNLSNGTFSTFNETPVDHVSSLSYDPASGLMFGISQSRTLASLVSIDSQDFAVRVVGAISNNTADASLGTVGGVFYYFLLTDSRNPPFLRHL